MSEKNKTNCVSIQDGVLKYANTHYLAGQPLTTGFDIFGYNYQAHMFRGFYANYYRGAQGLPPVEDDDVNLIMKWNDAWLSNKDCNNDGKLDRPSDYIGSGAWLTNHMTYLDENGQNIVYFVKIVAVPNDAELRDDGIWYTADGVEIGREIWGSFAIVQEVNSGVGKTYLSPAAPGFGKWK